MEKNTVIKQSKKYQYQQKIELNEKFLPLLNLQDGIRNFVFYGGRDSTKSWGIAITLILLSNMKQNFLFLCVKGTMNSISDSVKQLLENMIIMLGWQELFKITDAEIIHKFTGSRFIFKGLQKTERLKSLEAVDICWIEEANVDTNVETFTTLFPTIRKTGSKIIISFNPKLATDYVYNRFVLHPENNDYVIKLTYEDNKFLSNESKIEIDRVKNSNIADYLHIYQGELSTVTEGALWNRSLIKYQQLEEFSKIVVSVDPSVTSTGKQDACGLVMCAEKDGMFYVLEDASGIMSPEQWASKAVALYEKWEADHIVYETNQGGDLVKLIIQKIKPIRCIGVHASKGKLLRAEPILFLYEKDQVRHLRPFPDLEYEMLTYSGDPKQKSPNRLDAMVWGMTDLSQGKKTPRGMVRADLSNMNQEMRVGVMRPKSFTSF